MLADRNKESSILKAKAHHNLLTGDASFNGASGIPATDRRKVVIQLNSSHNLPAEPEALKALLKEKIPGVEVDEPGCEPFLSKKMDTLIIAFKTIPAADALFFGLTKVSILQGATILRQQPDVFPREQRNLYSVAFRDRAGGPGIMKGLPQRQRMLRLFELAHNSQLLHNDTGETVEIFDVRAVNVDSDVTLVSLVALASVGSLLAQGCVVDERGNKVFDVLSLTDVSAAGGQPPDFGLILLGVPRYMGVAGAQGGLMDLLKHIGASEAVASGTVVGAKRGSMMIYFSVKTATLFEAALACNNGAGLVKPTIHYHSEEFPEGPAIMVATAKSSKVGESNHADPNQTRNVMAAYRRNQSYAEYVAALAASKPGPSKRARLQLM